MYLLSINNRAINDIIESLVIDKEIKAILKQVILRYDYSYINFLYSLFSVYSKSYIRINNEKCELSINERLEILSTFSSKLNKVNYDNIFIADTFDVLFSISPHYWMESTKFNSFLYEDIYSRIENVINAGSADFYLEDIMESIEYISSFVESSIIRILTIKDEKSILSILHMHIDIDENNLYLTIY